LTIGSEVDTKRRRDLGEYFNQKKKFVGNDNRVSKKFFAQSEQRKKKEYSLLYSSIHTNKMLAKSIPVNQNTKNNDNYSNNSIIKYIGNADVSVISKNGEYKNMKKLGAYFSEKDIKPRFTESVLKKQRDSGYKFSDGDDDMLEAIDRTTMRSSYVKTLRRDHPVRQETLVNIQSTPDLTSENTKVEANNSKVNEQRTPN
jgi:hypothetical protein